MPYESVDGDDLDAEVRHLSRHVPVRVIADAELRPSRRAPRPVAAPAMPPVTSTRPPSTSGWRCTRRSARARRSPCGRAPSATATASRRPSRRRRRRGRPRGERGGPGRQRVGHLVRTPHRQPNVGVAPRRAQRNDGRSSSSSTTPSAATSSGRSDAEGQHAGRRAAGHPATSSSSALSTAVPSGGSASTSSPFAAATSSSDPEHLRVGERDDRHHADRRAGDVAQQRDVAAPSGAHLDDDRLRVVGCVGQRQRDAELVVERPLARRGAVALGEDRRGEVLHRRLADRAGDPDDGVGQRAAARRPSVEQRCTGVLDDDGRAADGRPAR